MVSVECNIPKATVYRVISESEELQKTEDNEGKIIIKLKGTDLQKPSVAKQPSDTIEIEPIISKGEGAHTEFKSSLRWDYRQNTINKDLEFEIVKATAAFLNTDGGKLFIGIDDEGNILGLSSDYNTLGKKNKDGFQLQLMVVG